jgi:hypothetical protein
MNLQNMIGEDFIGVVSVTRDEKVIFEQAYG